MAAPSGLTRFTASPCVGPLPASRGGGAYRRIPLANAESRAALFRRFRHDRFLDDNFVNRLVAAIRLYQANLVDRFLRLGILHLAERRVLAIEARLCIEADEELRAR